MVIHQVDARKTHVAKRRCTTVWKTRQMYLPMKLYWKKLYKKKINVSRTMSVCVCDFGKTPFGFYDVVDAETIDSARLVAATPMAPLKTTQKPDFQFQTMSQNKCIHGVPRCEVGMKMFKGCFDSSAPGEHFKAAQRKEKDKFLSRLIWPNVMRTTISQKTHTPPSVVPASSSHNTNRLKCS